MILLSIVVSLAISLVLTVRFIKKSEKTKVSSTGVKYSSKEMDVLMKKHGDVINYLYGDNPQVSSRPSRPQKPKKEPDIHATIIPSRKSKTVTYDVIPTDTNGDGVIDSGDTLIVNPRG